MKKRASRNIFRHFIHTKFFMFVLLISNHTVFLVQFGINLHLWVFQKAEIANWTRNRMITYTKQKQKQKTKKQKKTNKLKLQFTKQTEFHGTVHLNRPAPVWVHCAFSWHVCDPLVHRSPGKHPVYPSPINPGWHAPHMKLPWKNKNHKNNPSVTVEIYLLSSSNKS